MRAVDFFFPLKVHIIFQLEYLTAAHTAMGRRHSNFTSDDVAGKISYAGNKPVAALEMELGLWMGQETTYENVSNSAACLVIGGRWE